MSFLNAASVIRCLQQFGVFAGVQILWKAVSESAAGQGIRFLSDGQRPGHNSLNRSLSAAPLLDHTPNRSSD